MCKDGTSLILRMYRVRRSGRDSGRRLSTCTSTGAKQALIGIHYGLTFNHGPPRGFSPQLQLTSTSHSFSFDYSSATWPAQADRMPRDLPGLYWDEEKKRYFPISSRPAGSTPTHPAATASQPQKHGKRRRRSPRRTSSDSPSPKRQHAADDAQSPNAWRSFNALRGSALTVHRRRCVQYVVWLN